MPTRKINLKFTPYAEQRAVLNADARFRVVAAGRRSGKTLMAAAETVRRAVEGGDGWHGYWVGAEHRHADTAFRLIDKALPDDLVERRNQSPPRTIELTTGATIEFHTAGGGALVSIGLDWVVCDEAGKDFPERSWTQELRPALSDREGGAMFISTPGGKGWFYDAFQRGQSPDHPAWASWRWASYANPHVADEEIDDAKAEIPDRVFEQEYLAEFMDESGGVFTGLDDRLFTADYDLPLSPGDDPETAAAEPFAIGVDLARHEDYRVIVVIDAYGRVVYFDRDRGESWPAIQREIEQVSDRYDGVVRIDASRDNKLVADCEAAGVPVKPVKFTQSRKADMIESLIATVEAGDLSAPDIPALRHELEVFEADVTPAGNVRYAAPSGFHDDTVDALALACEGYREATRGGRSATAHLGGEDEEPDGKDLDGIVAEQARRRQNRWK